MFEIEGKTNQELVVMASSLAQILRPAIAGIVFGGDTITKREVDGDRINAKMHAVVKIDFSGDIRGLIESEILPHAVKLWEVSEEKNIRTAVEQMFGEEVLEVVKKGVFPPLPEIKDDPPKHIPNNVMSIFSGRVLK